MNTGMGEQGGCGSKEGGAARKISRGIVSIVS
jgi:hypothetical protein